MPNKDPKTDTADSTENIDLNALADLNFGPSWADASLKSNKQTGFTDKYDKEESKNLRTNSKRFKKDRRTRIPTSKFNKASDPTDRQPHSRLNQKFEPSFNIKIYPQDNTFDALVKRLKVNCKTYQLFEITRVILEKQDRYIVLISRLDTSDNSDKKLYYCPKDNVPFDTEEGAIDYFVENYLDSFFEIESVEVEPPSGNFSLVYKCPFTDILIGPPNFHRFQELLKIHHKSKIKNLSLEEYQSKLVAVNDESVINDWLEAMKKGERLTVKNSEESKVSFQSREDAKRYLVLHHKKEIVHSAESIRFPAHLIEKLPKGSIRKNIQYAIEGQKKFPLDTANNIRGRLRRHKFTIYKKGSKGISYVCSVKRKFRDSTTVFTDTISALIEFIEKNQQISVADLPYRYLDLSKPNTTDLNESNVSNKSDDSVEETAQFNIEAFSDDDKERIKQLFRDLKWLITEGYVTEYSNGTLFVQQILPESSQTSDSKEVNQTKKNDALNSGLSEPIHDNNDLDVSKDIASHEAFETEDSTKATPDSDPNSANTVEIESEDTNA